MESETEAVVELRNVSKRYGEGETAVQALMGVNMKVYAGEVLLIQGPSGSGKTTLLSILGLLLRPSSGEVWVQGREVAHLSERHLPSVRARTFGFVFQGFNLFSALTALENVALPLRMKKTSVQDPEAEARSLLSAVGLTHRMHALPEELSGGQKQRVAIARALAGSPQLILADEPTAALDTTTALSVMELLAGLTHHGNRSLVVVTHDARLERYADRVVRVVDGTTREHGQTRVLDS